MMKNACVECVNATVKPGVCISKFLIREAHDKKFATADGNGMMDETWGLRDAKAGGRLIASKLTMNMKQIRMRGKSTRRWRLQVMIVRVKYNCVGSDLGAAGNGGAGGESSGGDGIEQRHSSLRRRLRAQHLQHLPHVPCDPTAICK